MILYIVSNPWYVIDLHFLAETSKLVIEAESLEKLWNGKIVKEKKLEFEKSLEKLRKKHEKVKKKIK